MKVEVNKSLREKILNRKPVELTIRKKIKLLEIGKNIYINSPKNSTGMCLSISDGVRQWIGEENGTCLLISDGEEKRLYLDEKRFFLIAPYCSQNIVPEFNFNNILSLSKKYGFDKPKDNFYWWNITNTEARLKAFDALIEELRLKL